MGISLFLKQNELEAPNNFHQRNSWLDTVTLKPNYASTAVAEQRFNSLPVGTIIKKLTVKSSLVEIIGRPNILSHKIMSEIDRYKLGGSVQR